MAVSIPQVVTEDRASGASVIGGSLRFDTTKGQYLKFTPSSSGNRRTQTLSVWIKNTYSGSDNKVILGGGDNASGPRHNIYYTPTKRFGITQNPTGSSNIAAVSVGQFRDFSGWQHLVMQLDCTVGQNSGQVRIYVNGKLQENGDYAGGGSAAYITDQDGIFNTINKRMYLGHYAANPTDPAEFDGYMAQYYWIDGLALGPSYFGYTDPLTNTWRPRKFRAEGTTVNDGTDWSGSTTNLTNGPNGFNGNLGNYAEVSSSAAKGTFTFPKSIKVENSITFWFSSGTAGNLFINDEATPMGATGGFHQQDIEFTGTLSSISLQSGSQPVLYGIAVDGIILESTVTQNLDFGTNGVYLPFDGSAPIGQDQSGKGNNYTPVNFGGSTDITKATGAKPILNTGNGGTVARPGVFGSEVSAFYETTSASNSGGQYYFSHDSSAKPTFSFVRGATYTFDYSASSSHPLRFATAADAAGSTEYTDGTSISGNVIKFTVPHNAPDTLYYYCNVHNGMGNSITVTTDETKADPYAWKNVLAMPLVGNSNDVSNNLNVGSTTKALTTTGATSSSSNSNFYNTSFTFDGTDDRIAAATSSDFTFGTGDFTIEGWVYPETSNANKSVFSTNWGANGSLLITYSHPQSPSAAGKFAIFDYTSNSGTPTVATSNTYDVNNWYHVAFVRNGTSHKFYINGIEDGSATYTASNLTRDVFAVGAVYTTGTETFDGFIQDVRIYNGVAKYTSNFIPASTNPDILPDSPSGVATKSKLKKITDGAVAFDGSSSYLSVDHSTDFDLTNGDFTLEGYFNHTHTSGYVTACGIWREANGADYWSYDLRMTHNGTVPAFIWTTNGTSVAGTLSATTPTGNSGWHHIAVTRSGTSLRIFVDGKLEGSTTTSDTFNTASSQPFVCGNRGTTYYDGFMSNVRLIKGTALYTSDFTPPTRELTDVTNTKLLCCQSTVEPGGAAVAPSISGINDGTNWSHYVTGDIDSSFPAWRAFRNDTVSVGCRTQTANGATIVWQPPSPIAFSSSFKIWAARDGTHAGTTFTVTHAGGDTNFTSSVVTSTTQTAVDLAQIGGVTSPITKITIVSGGPNPRFSGIEVDSVMLVDPISPRGSTSATTFNPFTTDINTVRGQEGAYATLNPLDASSTVTLSRGNLVNGASSNTVSNVRSTISLPSTGKYYFEYKNLVQDAGYPAFGMAKENVSVTGAYNVSGSFVVRNIVSQSRRPGFEYDGNNHINMTPSATPLEPGDIISVLVDMDKLKAYVGINNRLYGRSNATTMTVVSMSDVNNGTNPAYELTGGEKYFAWASSYGTSATGEINFGQKPFKFPPPDGFQPLTSSIVRPDTVITRPNQYVGPLKYTGKPGGSQQDQSKIAFTPDMVWVKRRNAAEQHKLYDTVRGKTGSNFYHIEPNNNTAQAGESGAITEMLPGGFYATGGGHVNSAGEPFIAWMWRAGGGNTTGSAGDEFWKDGIQYANAAAANITQGTLPLSAASIGTKQGFSICQYTSPSSADGSTWGHGLSQAPDFIMSRMLNAGGDISIYHSAVPDKYFLMNSNAGGAGSNNWTVTSTTVTMGAGLWTSNNQNSIAYHWHNVPGLQKFGKYKCNGDGSGGGNEDGPFVELGFRPAMILFKGSNYTSDYTWIDQERCRINYNDVALRANYHYGEIGNARGGVGSSSQPENYAVDFLSNGFKIRASGGSLNSGTNEVWYAAWAEAPSFNLFGAQSNAR